MGKQYVFRTYQAPFSLKGLLRAGRSAGFVLPPELFVPALAASSRLMIVNDSIAGGPMLMHTFNRYSFRQNAVRDCIASINQANEWH